MNSENVISHLKREIKARDKDIHQAAVYGKQLYDETVELKSKIDQLNFEKETLQQEKYSLQLQLESSIKTTNSLTSECELQRSRADDLVKQLQITKKENESMDIKFRNLIKENQCIKKIQDDLVVENNSLKERISFQDKEIRNFQDQTEKSLCEIDNEVNLELQTQLQSYISNNKELKEALTGAQCQLEIFKRNENRLMQMIKDFEEAIQERDSEIRTSAAEIKKLKEDIEELQAEMELLKFDKIDTNQRGNSVFAELDDRRNMVEREYKILLKKFQIVKENFEENKIELDQARGQIAMLQAKTSRDYQQTYINKLEESLSAAKREILELTVKLSKLMEKNVEFKSEVPCKPQQKEYNYLRLMLSQTQERKKELENETMNLRMKILSAGEERVKAQQLLHKSKQDLDLAKEEITNLNRKVKDLECGHVQNICTGNETSKPNVEYLDGFKPVKEKTEIKKVFRHSLDLDMLPGELELDDSGFRQIKPPRKSNKFVLQEFNRIEDKGKSETSQKYSHTEVLDKKIADQNKIDSQCDRHQESRHSEEALPLRRNNNCAQQ